MGKKPLLRPVAGVLLFLVFAFQNCSKVQFNDAPPASASEASSELPDTPSTIQGVVTNALSGLPLAGVAVKIVSASGQTQTLSTNSAGQFISSSIAVGTASVSMTLQGYIPVSNLNVEVKAGSSSQVNQSLSPALATGQIRIVLNWTGPKYGAVQDVDAYLKIPSDRWPLFFDSRQGTGANLDIDIVNWRGPETITINNLQNGTYRYYVNNYDTRQLLTALGSSSVRIAVYQGSSLIRTYTVPPGSGITFEVFQIVNGQIVDVLRYTEDLEIAY